MAKPKPTIEEMESALGYSVNHSVYIDDIGRRFYSHLVPISDDPYERIEKEYLSIQRAQEFQARKEDSSHTLLSNDIKVDSTSKPVTIFSNNLQIISREGHIITVSQMDAMGFFQFLVDLQYAFGLNLPFIFTVEEAFCLASVAQLPQLKIGHQFGTDPTVQQQRCDSTSQDRPTFLNLPRELRDKIYSFALQGHSWISKAPIIQGRQHIFCRSVGDPSGFYFPLSVRFALLAASRQIRQEALPLAYRHTCFFLKDVEDLVLFLVAVGCTGRANIEYLDFAWESQIDLDNSRRGFPESETNRLTLPSQHVPHCIQLLKQCSRLKTLYLLFDSYIMLDMSAEVFMSDPGIVSLISLEGLQEVATLSTDGEDFPDSIIMRWLRAQLICI